MAAGYPLIFVTHALQRMAQRGISVADVRRIIETGEVINEYPHDTPYASRLMLGWRGPEPLYVVAADNAAQETIISIAYVPDPAQWELDFKRRKP